MRFHVIAGIGVCGDDIGLVLGVAPDVVLHWQTGRGRRLHLLLAGVGNYGANKQAANRTKRCRFTGLQATMLMGRRGRGRRRRRSQKRKQRPFLDRTGTGAERGRDQLMNMRRAGNKMRLGT